MLIAVTEFKNLLRTHKEASVELRGNAAVLTDIVRAFRLETSKTNRVLKELHRWQRKHLRPDAAARN